ncbi:hypothetical protein H6784_00070 [Candidatus Nomurabacteria bacterium]|nr:hypothetical protein [Candidatus Kaiserbacteria bacterium]MCB9813788.1 hypothetical protein [Candidatus Nomurabacteria bacterium]
MTEEVTLEQIETLFAEYFGPISTAVRELRTSAGEVRTNVGEIRTNVGSLSTSVSGLIKDVRKLSSRVEETTEVAKNIRPGRVYPVLSGPPTRHYHTVTELHSAVKPIRIKQSYLG